MARMELCLTEAYAEDCERSRFRWEVPEVNFENMRVRYSLDIHIKRLNGHLDIPFYGNCGERSRLTLLSAIPAFMTLMIELVC